MTTRGEARTGSKIGKGIVHLTDADHSTDSPLGKSQTDYAVSYPDRYALGVNAVALLANEACFSAPYFLSARSRTWAYRICRS